MWIAGGSGTGYHPNTRVKVHHLPYVSRMSGDKSWMMLFCLKVFQVGVSGNSGVGIGVHIGKVDKDEAAGKTDSMVDRLRWRVQIGY